MSDEDIALLAQHHVGVSHNPESNMKLASGTAPVAKYLKAGVALGLGTDGAASNNDLDMFEAMRQAAFLHKLATRDPRALPAATVLEMATLGGARVLGMERQLGSLEPGKRADLIIVGMSQAAADAPVRCRLAPRLRHARRRRRDDDREREGADGEQEGADARRSHGAGARRARMSARGRDAGGCGDS